MARFISDGHGNAYNLDHVWKVTPDPDDHEFCRLWFTTSVVNKDDEGEYPYDIIYLSFDEVMTALNDR